VTSPDHIWQQVTGLLQSAQSSVVLVAPFIKKSVFEAAINVIPGSVHRIECVTRWTPAEVASGVSDPDILSIAEQDPRIQVKLCPSLHAKVYAADDRCLVGSANLTNKAIGQAANANLEILVEVHTGHPEVQRVLTGLTAVAIEATPDMAALVLLQAKTLQENATGPSAQLVCWYPTTRRPENLYAYYSGRARFAPAVEAGIVQDLALLDIPVGLPEAEFDIEVRARLHVIPELSKLARGEKLGNLELQSALVEDGGFTDEKARRTSETIAAWLKHFDNYYMDVGSWELRQGREL
jgi:hypothetical protein